MVEVVLHCHLIELNMLSCDTVTILLFCLQDIKSEAEIVLVANKCDLSNDRVISSQKGQLVSCIIMTSVIN